MIRQHSFRKVVTSEAALRELVGAPSDLVIRKQLPALDKHCRAFIARSPFVLVGTASAAGTCDVSPRGDLPGFVSILDEQTLFIPERPGNRRADTLRNILETGRVGLLFLIPDVEETLRVNGSASIVQDDEILELTAHQGRRPLAAIAVDVEEAFLHCAKAFKRSHLWEHARWIGRGDLPSLARMVHDQVRPAGVTVEDVERNVEESYVNRLY